MMMIYLLLYLEFILLSLANYFFLICKSVTLKFLSHEIGYIFSNMYMIIKDIVLFSGGDPNLVRCNTVK